MKFLDTNFIDYTYKSSLWLSGGFVQKRFDIKSIPIGLQYLNKKGWGFGYEFHFITDSHEFGLKYRIK